MFNVSPVTNAMTRRSFAALAAGSLGAVAATAGVSVARADEVAWDEECEVLVIGSGYAGLAAALTAKAVSYTHLDVYKRQLSSYIRRIILLIAADS